MDLPVTLYMLLALERILDKLERRIILDELLPLLWDVRLQDPDIIQATVNIYRVMLTDNKKYGLSVNLMATRVMPSLLPLTMNAALHLDQFTSLLEVLQEMLDTIDKNQRNKLKLDDLVLNSPDHRRTPAFRHHTSSDNMAAVTTSGPSSPDSNLLRVHSAMIGRRLSDNELLNPPKIRVGSYSCGSSASDLRVGVLPIRRHSSTGPNERRQSVFSISPPTCGSMPNTSLSVPPSAGAGLRRQSACGGGLAGSFKQRRSSYVPPGAGLTGGGGGGGGLLHQLSAGMVSPASAPAQSPASPRRPSQRVPTIQRQVMD
ncbi:SCY1-like protein 2 isoform X6 [Amphibalanus amphitrite]|uniref:SCY1-like protein 2 isoform X6 n=1 Tax=Amphibalanus amphitrite TaxID=1232801 RepID=UPI001C9147B8|nr:SCY1-like protein 2 isoform X6 [Amphibalanus amphitrite]